MARDHLLAIDQGTTSTRAVVYDKGLTCRSAQAEVSPTYPKPAGSNMILLHCRPVGPRVVEALKTAGLAPIGLQPSGLPTMPRNDHVWDRDSGEAIGPALVWQDRRTADFCERHRDRRPGSPEKTGLVISTRIFLRDENRLAPRPYTQAHAIEPRPDSTRRGHGG